MSDDPEFLLWALGFTVCVLNSVRTTIHILNVVLPSVGMQNFLLFLMTLTFSLLKIRVLGWFGNSTELCGHISFGY